MPWNGVRMANSRAADEPSSRPRRTRRAARGWCGQWPAADHWRWVSTPRWRRTSSKVTSIDQRKTNNSTTRCGDSVSCVVKKACGASLPAGSTTSTQRIGSGGKPRVCQRQTPLSTRNTLVPRYQIDGHFRRPAASASCNARRELRQHLALFRLGAAAPGWHRLGKRKEAGIQTQARDQSGLRRQALPAQQHTRIGAITDHYPRATLQPT